MWIRILAAIHHDTKTETKIITEVKYCLLVVLLTVSENLSKTV